MRQDIDLPKLALSVRQPWAWAIIHAGKDIENRSLGAIRAGGMVPGNICIHAASGMKEDEYTWALWRMAQDGLEVPRPEALVRSAIIGVVEVVEILTQSDSPWFGGQAGLRLANPRPVAPVPCPGALGYFEWTKSGKTAAPKPWMLRYDQARGKPETPSLFPDEPPSFRTNPKRPF